jgi:hypothetical protein
MEKAKVACDGYRTKETKLKTEVLGGLAAWREKFIGPWRVANVSRKGARGEGVFLAWRLGVGFFVRMMVQRAAGRRRVSRGSAFPSLLFRHHSPFTHRPLPSIPIKVNKGWSRLIKPN